jgi:alkanesulfonate monooxygenase SsuD/methylene tetrahydromethanopterin reductase-like flavin-dependent oxidoreductase (luciferase family)
MGGAFDAARQIGRTNRAVLPIGSAEECAAKLSAYARAGAQRVFLWPLADEREQLEVFSERVVPLLDGRV